jgi:hypothetical protein
LAIALLVAANLVPLVGVLFFGWELMTILVAYWLENGIVGLLNVLRLALAAGDETSSARGGGAMSSGKLAVIPFFAVHYGIFWVVHGVFVFALPRLTGAADAGPTAGYVAVAALALALSHAGSFLANYLGRGEYRRARVGELFLAPYGRVVVLHLTVLLGGFLIIDAGGPALVMALLVALKTVLDLGLHLREHVVRQSAGSA